MQKVSSPDWTDLTLSKESRSRDGTESFLHDSAVVMRLTEESLSSPATTEQKSPERRAFVFHSLRSQENVQIIACRLRVAKVELHGLAFLNDISDRNSSGLLIRSDQIPNEEIPALEMIPVLIDHDAQMQRAVRIAALGSPHGFKDILEPFQRRNST